MILHYILGLANSLKKIEKYWVKTRSKGIEKFLQLDLLPRKENSK